MYGGGRVYRGQVKQCLGYMPMPNGASTEKKAYAIRHRIQDQSLRIEVSIFLPSTKLLYEVFMLFLNMSSGPSMVQARVNRKRGPSYPVYKHRPFFPRCDQ